MASNLGSPRLCVELSADGGVTWTSPVIGSGLSTGEQVLTYGSGNSTWGKFWSGGQLNGNNLRVRITTTASDAERDFYLDYVAVNVWYSP
jgi:hypothetical protein